MSSSISPLHAAPTAATARVRTGPVLVATDGLAGDGALLAGRDAAAHLHAELRLVSVLEPDSVYVVGAVNGLHSPSYEAERREERKHRVRRQCEDALGVDPRGSGIRIDIPAGPVGHGVQAAAVEHHASLVVVSHERRDPLRRFLMGESALRIARRAPCATLFVQEATAIPFQAAVVGIDFSASSIAAAREALRLLAPDGTLHLVHAWPRHGDRERWMREHDEHYANALPERLARVRALVDAPAGVRVETSAVVGRTVEALLDVVERTGAPLVAAGRRSHDVLDRLLLGSITTRLVRAAPCAVLVSPEPSPAVADPLDRALHAPSAESDMDGWPALLDEFVRRNQGRRVLLEEANPRLGTHVEAVGYELLGASYDRRDRRVLVMLGRAAEANRHLTHSVGSVQQVSTVRAPDGQDLALRLLHQDSWTLLTFLSNETG